MKSTFKKVAALATIACMAFACCFALAACGGSGQQSSSSSAAQPTEAEFTLVVPGKLTVGSDLDYKPMEFLEEGVPAGFSIDMMTEIANRIGLELNVLPPQNFDSIVTQVAGGSSMDVGVSSFTINDERAELIDFSDPYFDSNQAVVTLASAPYTSKEELDGQPIGAQSGTTGEEWVKENLKNSEYTPYTMPSDALAALRAGKIQAVVYDSSVALNHIANDPGTYKLVEEIATGEQYGITVNKENKALLAAINDALASMEADGTMEQIKAKWFE